MATKKTVVEMFEEIKAMPGLTEEQIAFLDKRIEITKKKNASGNEKLTPKQKEKNDLDEHLKEVILGQLTTAPTTIASLSALSDELSKFSNQKMTFLLGALVKENKVVRTEVKGKAYFALATED